MNIFKRKKYVSSENFQSVIKRLSVALEALREEYIFGSLSQLKKEGVDVARISREIETKSELEEILIGFQLTCIIGIAWNYIRDVREEINFNKIITKIHNAEEGTRAWNYRQKYVDCRGDMALLSKYLSEDVHRAIGYPQPREEFIIQFQGGATPLIALSQIETCLAFGDEKEANSIKKAIGMTK